VFIVDPSNPTGYLAPPSLTSVEKPVVGDEYTIGSHVYKAVKVEHMDALNAPFSYKVWVREV